MQVYCVEFEHQEAAPRKVSPLRVYARFDDALRYARAFVAIAVKEGETYTIYAAYEGDYPRIDTGLHGLPEDMAARYINRFSQDVLSRVQVRIEQVLGE